MFIPHVRGIIATEFPIKGILTWASFTQASFFDLDKEKEHVKLSSWHEQVFIEKFARANGAFNEQRLVDVPLEGDANVWITIATILRQGYFRAAQITHPFKESVRAFF